MNSHPPVEQLRDLDALANAERATVLAHVRTCGACRAVVIAERPEALFGLLAQRPVPPEALARLSTNVLAAIDALEAQRPGTGVAGVARRRWMLAGSIAASLLLGLALGWPLLRQDTGPRIAEVTTPAALPATPAADEFDAPTLALPVRGLELLSSPGDGEVVDFAIGDAQVVMIFDKELDI